MFPSSFLTSFACGWVPIRPRLSNHTKFYCTDLKNTPQCGGPPNEAVEPRSPAPGLWLGELVGPSSGARILSGEEISYRPRRAPDSKSGMLP